MTHLGSPELAFADPDTPWFGLIKPHWPPKFPFLMLRTCSLLLVSFLDRSPTMGFVDCILTALPVSEIQLLNSPVDV